MKLVILEFFLSNLENQVHIFRIGKLMGRGEKTKSFTDKLFEVKFAHPPACTLYDSISTLLLVSLRGLLFGPEDGSDMFL
jgi:hypothetical protein